MDLVGIELEHRHGGMPGLDPLRQGFPERLDWIAVVQGPKWWCDLERALSDAVNRVTPRAIVQRKHLAALFGGRGCQSRHR